MRAISSDATLTMLASPRCALALAFVGVAALPAQSAERTRTSYLVLAAVADGDPYDAAVDVLVKGRHAVLQRFDVADLEPLRAVLRETEPRHVAIVLRPEQLDFDLARRFLKLSTEVDDDPFVDFAFGYITGRDAEDAVALARAGVAREPLEGDPRWAMVAGDTPRSQEHAQPLLLRDESLAGRSYYCAGERTFPEAGRDVAFLGEAMAKLDGAVDMLTFAGHGYPQEVVGGPRAQDVRGLDLSGAVVLNVACYTGVTSRWFEPDPRAGVERERIVAPEDSFSLAILGAGVVGYTAYLCPRPAGPELDCDRASLIADGLSLGEARRRDYDKTVLGFLGYGEDGLALEPMEDGAKLRRTGDDVRDFMLEGATGGVLFGDPACVPFARREGQSPVAVEAEAERGGLRIRAEAGVTALYLHCSDPTAQMGGKMAMKVHARIPLGELQVADVVVDDLRIGHLVQTTRVLWAVEEDQGERFLQLKVNFPRGEVMSAPMTMSARVVAAESAEAGRTRGGEVVRPPVVVRALGSRTVEPYHLQIAERREVSPAALQAVLDASASLLPQQDGAPEVPPDAMDRLITFGSEGFRAACVLIECGQVHYRTHELLAATWHPGDERILLALAAGPALPKFGDWAVLRGLGVADTPVVRRYLLTRLAREQDAGLFMSAAQGLAMLGERDVARMIGERILEFRDGWGGVAPPLVVALEQLGGERAEEYLDEIAEADVAGISEHAVAALQRMRGR